MERTTAMTRSRVARVAAVLVGFGALLVAPASPAVADLEVSFGYRTPALTRAVDDRLTLFATDGADRVWRRAQSTPGADTWTGWTEVGGRMRTLAAETAADGRTTLAGLDRTGKLWLRNQATPGGAFTDWASLDGDLVSIGLVPNTAGTLDLFGTTASGALSRRRLPDGAWQPVFNDVRSFAVETDGTGRIGVFFIHRNGIPYVRVEDAPGGGWAPLRGLGGYVTSLAAARNSAGGLEFFGTDAAGRIQHRWQPGPGQPWEGSDPLAGRARSLAAETNADGRIELVGLENIGSAYHQWQRPGGWSPWTRLPGDLAATYADGGSVTTLDGNIHENSVGRSTSIATAADGLGLVSYSDSLFGDLKVAHCDNTACTTATTSRLDTTTVTGRNTAITTNRSGIGVIAYTSRPMVATTSADLRVALCDNIACTAAHTSTLVFLAVADGPLSVTTVGYGNDPLVVFHGTTAGNRLLQMAYCEMSTLCGTVATRTLGIAGNLDSAPSVTTGPDGLGLIVWEGREGTERLLNVSHCRDQPCSVYDTVVVDRDPAALGGRNSVTFGADGLPLITYGKGNGLYLVHCTTATCGSGGAGVPTLIESGFDVGASSVRVGDDGLGIISYHDRTAAVLRAAHCGNVACTTSTKATFARVGTNPDHAMTIGSDGLPLVSHYNSVAGALTVAHCANVRCVSFRVPATLTAPPPPADGVRGVQVWSCSYRPLAMWVNDKTAGTGWTRIATQPTNWPRGPECGLSSYNGEPWTFTPAAGHVYDIRAVDYTATGCVDNPEYSPCWRLNKRDVLGNPSGALHRDVTREP